MPNDDTVGKGGGGGENVSKSDGVILGCSLSIHDILKNSKVLRRNTDEGQHQDLDAGVVNSNHY